MSNLFLFLFLISLVMIPAVIIKPQILKKYLKRDFARPKAGLLMLVVAIPLFVLFGLTTDISTEKTPAGEQSQGVRTEVAETSNIPALTEEQKNPDEFLV